ncbi:MAG: hypothetical protein AAFW87_01610 [Pseudomonadota bacterium]
MANFSIYHPSVVARRSFCGRLAQVLNLLIEEGERGLTAAGLPTGVRLAAYVYRLRHECVPIDTQRDCNYGPWGGHHARYALAARVEREDTA